MDLNFKPLKYNAVSTGIQEGLAVFLLQVHWNILKKEPANNPHPRNNGSYTPIQAA